jgi:hypothetical protein
MICNPNVDSDDGSSGGNDGTSNETISSPNENNKWPVVNFDAILVICVIIIVTMSIAVVVLFVYFQKRIKQIEKKQTKHITE